MFSIEYLLVCIIILLVLILFKNQNSVSKDIFLINLAVLDHVIDDYIQIIFNSKIEQHKVLYNLNPESKVNSIKSYKSKVNAIISESTVEIIKLLTKQVRRNLKKSFSDKSLALYISNKISTITWE